MPGLFGILLKRPDRIDPHSLSCMARKMADAMRHAPWLSVELGGDDSFFGGRISLGSLNPVPQPLISGDGRHHVWFDGHYFSTPASAHHATPTADEAVRLLSDSGVGLSRVDGIFNLACYRPDQKELIVANDRLGFRPLYYMENVDWFAYAAEVKALLAIRDQLPQIDEVSFRQFFSQNSMLGEHTWWKGIELVPPASVWRITTRADSRLRYWSFDHLPAERMTPADGDAEFSRLWSLEVRRYARPGTMPILLSGGLDSRLLLAELLAQRADVVAVTFGSPDSPEVKRARLVASIAGVPQRVCYLDTDNWWYRRDEAIWNTDGLVNGDHLHSATTLDELHAGNGYSAINVAGDLLFGGSHLTAGYFMPDWHRASIEKVLSWMYIRNPFCSREEFVDLSFNDAARYAQGPSSDCYHLLQQYRRYILYFPVALMSHCEIGFPGLGHDLLRLFLGSFPDEARRGSTFYNQFLATRYRKYYLNIPWERTGRALIETHPVRLWRDTASQFRRSLRYVGRRIRRLSPHDFRQRIRSLVVESDAERVPMVRWFVDYQQCVEKNRLREKLLQQDLVVDDYFHGAVRRVLADPTAHNLTPRVLIALLTLETYLRQVTGSPYGVRLGSPSEMQSSAALPT